MLVFVTCAVRNGLILPAMEHCSLTTILFPAAVGMACIAFFGPLTWRRRRVAG